jgi:hypothetical protein
MTTLHAFGCSITQGFALPDVVQPVLDKYGKPLPPEEVEAQGIHWSDIHLYQPSQYAWPQVLGDQLGIAVNNYARRGACFQQIARQCAVNVSNIKPEDTVIVMWTYLSRLSLQWPARTSVPFCNVVKPEFNWRTVVLGANNFFGLERADSSTLAKDAYIQKYIEASTIHTLDPLGMYNRYYNSLVLQTMTDGFLRATGARVIHLSVEPETSLSQLELARQDLAPDLREYTIPDPNTWYTLAVDHDACRVILDPTIPPAKNDMHPSVRHHRNFAREVYTRYFE